MVAPTKYVYHEKYFDPLYLEEYGEPWIWGLHLYLPSNFKYWGRIEVVDKKIDGLIRPKLPDLTDENVATSGEGHVRCQPLLAERMREWRRLLQAEVKDLPNAVYEVPIIINSSYRSAGTDMTAWGDPKGLRDKTDDYGHWIGWSLDVNPDELPAREFKPAIKSSVVQSTASMAGLALPHLPKETWHRSQYDKEPGAVDETGHRKRWLVPTKKDLEYGSIPLFPPLYNPTYELENSKSLTPAPTPIKPSFWDYFKYYLDPRLIKSRSDKNKGNSVKESAVESVKGDSYSALIPVSLIREEAYEPSSAAALGFSTAPPNLTAPAARSVVADAARAALARAAKDRNFRQYIDTVNIDTRGSFDAQKLLAALEAYGRSEVATVG